MPEMERLKLAIDHAQAMHKTLMLPKNESKGHWGNMTTHELLYLLDREIEEFKAALWAFISHGGSIDRAESEATDVSIFLAMIVDNLKRTKETR